MVTHPSTSQARLRLISSIETNALPLRQTTSEGMYCMCSSLSVWTPPTGGGGIMFSGRPLSIRLLTPILRDAVSLLSERICRKLDYKYSSCDWALLRRFSRAEVKGHFNN